ncbi:hypothetical protein ElyMa_002081000 [Elysia marginata]|uniref:Uncharacterized protein n=1 Tax=Elysia marginata TaxID=1093978 RepID=A0AAV4FD20_9GAST|nr:hypothetical protein ElyMa_002081000 [Elysia marginata]
MSPNSVPPEQSTKRVQRRPINGVCHESQGGQSSGQNRQQNLTDFETPQNYRKKLWTHNLTPLSIAWVEKQKRYFAPSHLKENKPLMISSTSLKTTSSLEGMFFMKEQSFMKLKESRSQTRQ